VRPLWPSITVWAAGEQPGNISVEIEMVVEIDDAKGD
jgi:hypothetical protein